MSSQNFCLTHSFLYKSISKLFQQVLMRGSYFNWMIPGRSSGGLFIHVTICSYLLYYTIQEECVASTHGFETHSCLGNCQKWAVGGLHSSSSIAGMVVKLISLYVFLCNFTYWLLIYCLCILKPSCYYPALQFYCYFALF